MRQNPIFSTSFGSVTITRAKYRIFVSLPFSQNLVPLLFTLSLPLFGTEFIIALLRVIVCVSVT